jgi:hypothetical protein
VRANSKERRPGRNGMARTVLFLAAAMTPSFALAREGSDSSSGGKVQALARLGEELFNREWAPRDARSPGGDGLGPLYNEKSCIACHHLGAAGGAGPSTKNIMILTVIAERERSHFSTLRESLRDRRNHPSWRRCSRSCGARMNAWRSRPVGDRRHHRRGAPLFRRVRKLPRIDPPVRPSKATLASKRPPASRFTTSAPTPHTATGDLSCSAWERCRRLP